jgi:hypothetical protein
MTKHKHYEAIMAWANGEVVEMKNPQTGGWFAVPNPGWYKECTYRVKPTPQPDFVHEVLIVCGMSAGPLLYAASSLEANCALVFDGETRKLKGCAFKAA